MSDRGPPKKKSDAFNNPFKAALTDLKKKQSPPPETTKTAKKASAPPPPSRSLKGQGKASKAREEDDASLFLSAMDGVAQMVNRGEAPVPNPRLPQIIDENAEALAELAELVVGQGDFSFSDSTEFIEGAAPGLDPRLMRSMRRGDFVLQGQLDLHGLTQVQAQSAVDRFLSESHRARHRCVLIIHGRGLNSPSQMSVLKEWLRGWLGQKRIGKTVLAFCSARPQDGGTGAVYVLLRR